jgi:hypothetical protein
MVVIQAQTTLPPNTEKYNNPVFFLLTSEYDKNTYYRIASAAKNYSLAVLHHNTNNYYLFGCS